MAAAEVDNPPPPVPLELSAEDIERIQSTQHFKSQQETFAVWKIPNFRENWQLHINAEGSRFIVDYGRSGEGENGPLPVKFSFNLRWQDPEEIQEYGGMYFYFRPTEIPSSVHNVTGKYRLEILKANGQVWKNWETGVIDWSPAIQLAHGVHEFESYYHNQLFLNIDNIINNQDILGAEDTLTLQLKFTRMAARVLEYPNAPRLQELVAKSADKVLASDMEALLHDPTDADVSIKTKDEVVFEVHKLILKRRVPMFRAMFETDMQERSSGVVGTPEISSGAMKILLHYIYTGKLHPDWKQWRALVHEVINGANQYGLEGLIQYYDHMLVTLCNDIDADDLLEVAKLHGLKKAEEDIGKWKRGIVME